jgi:hypothetical protein
MISFTDVLHDLVRRGLTLRFDPEGNLFIYEPPCTARPIAAKAEPPTTANANTGEPLNGVSMQILDNCMDNDAGMSMRHAAAMAARCRAAGATNPECPPPGPHWRGITWHDVPGHDESIQKLNFALLKRGMLRGHKCCLPLEGEALKQRLQDLSQRNRDNSQGRRGQSQKRHKANPRPKPP